MQASDITTSAPTGAPTSSQHFDPNVTMTSASAVKVVADGIRNSKGHAGEQVAGYIFMCNASTKADCFIYRVFGLPAPRVAVVENIKPNTKLFLFDFDVKLLYGLYVADASGKLAIEPYAFGGKFPAQVKFSIAMDCLPLPEAVFKDAIKENYYSGFKFRQELNDEQVNRLVSLFRPITIPSPPQASPVFRRAVESLHPGYRGSRVQIAELPSHGQYIAASRLAEAQLKPRLSHTQEVSLPPGRVGHNEVALAINDRLASQPSHSQRYNQQFRSAHAHHPYHPDDPGLHRHNTHIRYQYVAENSSSSLPPQPPAPVPPSSTMISSSLTASQWVAMASPHQIPAGQTSSFTASSSNEQHASYSGLMAYGYQNKGYPSSYQEATVNTDQGFSKAFEQQPTSVISYSRQSQSDPVATQTQLRHNGTYSTPLASEYQYQGYYEQTQVGVGLTQTQNPASVSSYYGQTQGGRLTQTQNPASVSGYYEQTQVDGQLTQTQNPTSLSSYYGQAQVDGQLTLTQSSTLASEYPYQCYYSSYQTLPVTTEQAVNQSASQTQASYWATATAAYTGQEQSIPQVTVSDSK